MIDGTRQRSGLLVSVRSAAEAKAALEGGADLIDVKEPARGPLGAADPAVIQEVIAAVAGRAPVSVARGEWNDRPAGPLPVGVAFVKFGLAGTSDDDAFKVAQEMREQIGATPVLVAYADHCRAQSPDPRRLVELAAELRFEVLLIDTFAKDGSTLVDWIQPSSLHRIRKQLTRANVALALAGSLTPVLIQSLRFLEPSWFAVRGAACVDGRVGTICRDRTRHLRTILS